MANFCVKGLSVSYQEKILFENLTFEVSFPAFVAVIGSNGSGKTSFFKCLLKQIPHRGEYLFDGKQLNVDSLASLPQHNELHFDIQVKDVVVMGLYNTKKTFQNYNNDDFERVKLVLKELGVAHLFEKNFQNLSGGEQQLVWLAQLILQDKKIWLLDEPLQQLDVKNKVKITEVLLRYAYEKQKLIFCITHDLHFLSELNKGWLLNLSEAGKGLNPISKEIIDQQLVGLSG